MFNVGVFLKRNFIIFKNNPFNIFLILFLLPMFIHMFVVIPLSMINFFHEFTKINYVSWSIVGTALISATMISFIIGLFSIKNIRYDYNILDTFLDSPINSHSIVIGNIVWSLIIGILELLLAIGMLVFIIDMVGLTTYDYILILYNSINLIVFFSMAGFLIGNFIEDNYSTFFLILSLFIFLLLGSGAIIPLDIYSQSYIDFSNYNFISGIIKNNQLIIQHENINGLSILINVLINIVFFILILVYSAKYYRK